MPWNESDRVILTAVVAVVGFVFFLIWELNEDHPVVDLKLFAGAEQDNSKAAVRLASDMGEFFMPFPGVRVNQQTTPLQAGDMSGYASSYEVKFSDTTKPNGQIWAGVVGNASPNAPRDQRNQRWFVVWLGTGKDPIDQAAAKTLADSIRPYTPPPAPVADPNVPGGDPNAPNVIPETYEIVGTARSYTAAVQDIIADLDRALSIATGVARRTVVSAKGGAACLAR